MWLTNLQVYRLDLPNAITATVLEEAFARLPFQPCGPNDQQSQGWVSPRNNGQMVYTVNRQMLFCLCTETKKVPGQMIKRVVETRASELEQQQGFKPGRKQMKEITEQVTDELLPRAFPMQSRTQVWLDPVNGWLVVDSSSPSKADEVFKMLLKSLDNLPAHTLRTECSPLSAMTDWLVSDEAPAGFTVDQDTELKGTSDGKPTVRYLRHTLDPEDVRRHITGGKQCTRLALTWSDRISFILTDNLTVKRVTPLDILKEKGEVEAANADERFDADFTLMAAEYNGLLKALVEALGGFETKAKAGEDARTDAAPAESPAVESELAAA